MSPAATPGGVTSDHVPPPLRVSASRPSVNAHPSSEERSCIATTLPVDPPEAARNR
jgi:hypothetical protein